MFKITQLYLFLTIFFWASTPAVSKLLLEEMDSFQISFYMILIAMIVLFLMVFVKRKSIKYDVKDYLTFAYMGGLGIFLYYILYFSSLIFISAQETTIINYLWPIMVIVFASLILKERITLKKIIAILLSFMGVYIVVSHDTLSSFTSSNIIGVLLAFLGAVSYSLFSVLGKKYNYDIIASMALYYLFSFIFIIPTILFFSEIIIPSIKAFIGLLWLGLFSASTGNVLWFLVLKDGETSKMANMIYLVPFISLVYIYFLTGEKILLSSLIGLILIVLGILIQYKR